MDEDHLGAVLRTVALNPVRARLVDQATQWPWSSVQAQLELVRDDHVTDTDLVCARYPDFAALIAAHEDEVQSNAPRGAESIGRPLGDAAFLDRLEHLTGRTLRPAKRRPKPHEHKQLYCHRNSFGRAGYRAAGS